MVLRSDIRYVVKLVFIVGREYRFVVSWKVLAGSTNIRRQICQKTFSACLSSLSVKTSICLDIYPLPFLTETTRYECGNPYILGLRTAVL